MDIQPLRNNIIVQRVEKDLTTASGIVLKTNDEADKALITAIGPDVEEVAVGDSVLINWNKAYKLDKEIYKVNVDDVIAVFED
jgi:co-chaperonin GroES (HSP10)